MRIIIFLLGLSLLVASCDEGFNRVEGNGVMETKEKTLNDFDEIEVSGNFKVKVVPSDNFRAVIEADENLHEYILVEQDGDRLKIRMKNNVNVKTHQSIKVTVYTNDVRRIELAGSCGLKSDGVLENTDRMEITIAGSGDADIDVKTPEMKVSIGGSGKVIIGGKTRDLKISIAGSGDFEGEKLMSENADISIAGSGSARVFTSVELKVSIAGSGDVYYAGKPGNVKKSIAGVGNVKPISDAP
jgi:hypothetical protein